MSMTTGCRPRRAVGGHFEQRGFRVGVTYLKFEQSMPEKIVSSGEGLSSAPSCPGELGYGRKQFKTSALQRAVPAFLVLGTAGCGWGTATRRRRAPRAPLDGNLRARRHSVDKLGKHVRRLVAVQRRILVGLGTSGPGAGAWSGTCRNGRQGDKS